jgi:hypothetical protein
LIQSLFYVGDGWAIQREKDLAASNEIVDLVERFENNLLEYNQAPTLKHNRGRRLISNE